VDLGRISNGYLAALPVDGPRPIRIIFLPSTAPVEGARIGRPFFWDTENAKKNPLNRSVVQ
jgi:hypothetical protein